MPPPKNGIFFDLTLELKYSSPNSNNLKLLSVMLSGTDVCVKAFQSKLPGTSFMDTDFPSETPCPHQPKGGTFFVSYKKYIQCTHLSMS